MFRRKLQCSILLIFLLLAAIVAIPSVLTYRKVQQEQLNQGLVAAVIHRKVGLVVRLLNSGANPNARPLMTPPQTLWQMVLNRWRHTPVPAEQSECALQVAVSRGHVVDVPENKNDREDTEKLVKVLLEGGADPNQFDERGASPLYNSLTYSTNTPAVALMLIKHGANINGSHYDVSPPLVTAANDYDDENLSIIRLLLDRGADVNVKGEDGYTALRQAAESGCVKDVKLLLSHKADVNARDSRGDTILASISRPVDDTGYTGPTPTIAALLKKAGARK